MEVSPAHRRRSLTDEEFGGGGTSAPPTRTTTTSTTARNVDPHVDRGVAEAIRNRTPSSQPRGDGILYVGMNQTSAGAELSALQQATHGNVTAILGRAGAELEAKFGKYDLTDDAQLHAFTEKLAEHYGLPKATGERLEKLLLGMTDYDKQGRDELGKIALYMARAESGGAPMPSRLVLSGHSNISTLYGDTADQKGHTGRFAMDDIRALGEIFPAAAKQIEDVHIGACFSEAQLEKHEDWVKAFPNLKTMWGYSGYSPGAPVGHLTAWELASRGRADKFSDGMLAPYANEQGHAAGWSKKGGLNDPGVTLTKMRDRAADADTRYDALVSGNIRSERPDRGTAHEDYAAYFDLAGRSGVSPSERAQLSHRSDVLYRVRHYETGVRGDFQKTHGAEVGRAFEALGLAKPDFAQLTRKEAMAEIDEFRRTAGSPPAPEYAEAARQLEALATLDPKQIPLAWCH